MPPVGIPQRTLYGIMSADSDRNGAPDHLDARAVRTIQRKAEQAPPGPVGSDIRTSIMLGLGVENLRGVGDKLAKKLDAATFGFVSTIDNFQDMQRPAFRPDGRMITNFPMPSDTPRGGGRLFFPVFTKTEQDVLKARWDALNSLSPRQPDLPQGFNRVDELGVENARRDPQITVAGQTKSHYWLPHAEVLGVDDRTRTATIGLSANRIFTIAGGSRRVGILPLPEGPREFKTTIDLDLPIVRPGQWTVKLVDANRPDGAPLQETSFLYDPISSPPPRDPRIS